MRGFRNDVWPLIFLASAVLLPTLGLLWFAGAAMRNERLAVRQKLADAYRLQLSLAQERLQQDWQETATLLADLVASNPPPVAFVKAAQSGLVDGVLIFDEAGRLLYPNTPSGPEHDYGWVNPAWQQASQFEQARNHLDAARVYHELAVAATNTHTAARAFQAETRCLARAAETETAIRLVKGVFGDDRFREATDPQGRLIAANVELFALELSDGKDESIATRLSERLNDYQNQALAASQRRFLMREAKRLAPDLVEFPTLRAEQLSAHLSATRPGRILDPSLRASRLPGVWQFGAANGRVLACIDSERALARLQGLLDSSPSPPDGRIVLVPPEGETAGALVTLAAGGRMPAWELAFEPRDRAFFEETAGRQTAVYLWTAILMLMGMGILTWLAARAVRKQMALARLKNDLAATISHELKTPLSSMRVLVETLLDSAVLEERQTRDYLGLIAQENARLSRLVNNILSFSRMERRKHTFQFARVPPKRVVEAAVDAVRSRLQTAGCRLEVEIEAHLPPVRADTEALTAALVNLLENACKFSEADKRIRLTAGKRNGCVVFAVTDHGIGIAPRERKRVFQPFYQVDRRLSGGAGGCGLGLGIVQFITKAHAGRVAVESQPGRGSTFTIAIPWASAANATEEET